MRYSIILFMLLLSLKNTHAFHLRYEPKWPQLYFFNEKIWIETDTTTFMKVLQKLHTEDRIREIKEEIDHRIHAAGKGKVMMDGINLHIYKNGKRTTYEASVLHNLFLEYLIKGRHVKIYDKNTETPISKITVKRVGSRQKNRVDKIYYNKSTMEEIFNTTLYHRQY